VKRLHAIPDFLKMMPISLNGTDPTLVIEAVQTGEWAVVYSDSCLACISCDGQTACIEMIEGRNGVDLTRKIVTRALNAGLRCEGWVLSKSRARLAQRCGMYETGKTRVSISGRIQYQVST